MTWCRQRCKLFPLYKMHAQLFRFLRRLARELHFCAAHHCCLADAPVYPRGGYGLRAH